MVKHTPTPWRMQDGARPYFNCGEDGCSFGPITHAGSVSQMIADAEFAVLAANSHDELLAVLKAIKRFGELANVSAEPPFSSHGGKKPASKDVWQFPRHMLVEIDAAILKAEGHQP